MIWSCNLDKLNKCIIYQKLIAIAVFMEAKSFNIRCRWSMSPNINRRNLNTSRGVARHSLLNSGVTKQQSSTLEMWGALAQWFPLDGSEADCDNILGTWTPPDALRFHQCHVELTCTPTTFASVTRFLITSTAICETGDSSSINDNCLRVNHQVEVEARD